MSELAVQYVLLNGRPDPTMSDGIYVRAVDHNRIAGEYEARLKAAEQAEAIIQSWRDDNHGQIPPTVEQYNGLAQTLDEAEKRAEALREALLKKCDEWDSPMFAGSSASVYGKQIRKIVLAAADAKEPLRAAGKRWRCAKCGDFIPGGTVVHGDSRMGWPFHWRGGDFRQPCGPVVEEGEGGGA